jgi:hypothetical protein
VNKAIQGQHAYVSTYISVLLPDVGTCVPKHVGTLYLLLTVFYGAQNSVNVLIKRAYSKHGKELQRRVLDCGKWRRACLGRVNMPLS